MNGLGVGGSAWVEPTALYGMSVTESISVGVIARSGAISRCGFHDDHTGLPAMGHALETRPERLRDGFRRTPVRRPNVALNNPGYTVRSTDPCGAVEQVFNLVPWRRRAWDLGLTVGSSPP